MLATGVLAPVTEPTEWISNMLLIVKPNKLHIYLDPRYLNKAIRQKHCQVLTVEEVVTCFSQAKTFTVVDAKDGFWQKRLDTESTYKTTFVQDLEVIADNFLITGFGSTDHDVTQSLERNEHAFPKKCHMWNLKLNCANVKRHQKV